MEIILSNLFDPAWWFTAFFPVLAVALAPRVWRGILLAVRQYSRKSRAKSLRRIRSIRNDDLLISKEMFSAQAAFLVFILSVAVGLILLVLNPFTSQSGTSRIFVSLLSLPILVSEIIWLMKDSRVGDIMKYRKKLRNATKSSLLADL